jgi:tight adherence protein C
MLGQAVIRRQESIRRALPDTLDLLSISVEAGLGFDAALMQVSRRVPGPLSQEIGRMMHEMQLGSSRAESFRHLADRVTAEEVRGFVLAMVQADVFGVSIANVLRAQSRELRLRRRQRAEERAMKIPVKLLFPMIFCILPALFVVIVGPGVIQIVDVLFGEGGLLGQ